MLLRARSRKANADYDEKNGDGMRESHAVADRKIRVLSNQSVPAAETHLAITTALPVFVPAAGVAVLQDPGMTGCGPV